MKNKNEQAKPMPTLFDLEAKAVKKKEKQTKTKDMSKLKTKYPRQTAEEERQEFFDLCG